MRAIHASLHLAIALLLPSLCGAQGVMLTIPVGPVAFQRPMRVP